MMTQPDQSHGVHPGHDNLPRGSDNNASRATSRWRLRSIAIVVAAAVALIAIAAAAWYALSRAPQRTIHPAAPAPAAEFSYAPFAAVLEEFVDERGMVDYARLKQNRDDLDTFAAHLAALEPEVYESWSEPEQIAFWTNAYNALTMLLIVEHYPIRRSAQPEGLAFPSNSIWQIPGRFDRVKFPVMGREMSLDDIEHATLRVKFDEPRIHVALVCAANGCPPLRTEPYRGDLLEEQLDDQSVRFLRDPRHFRIDHQRQRVHLSSIFKWFGDDFISRYAPESGFGDHRAKERAVLNYISGYLSPDDQAFLRHGDHTIRYLSYDWSLNEQ